MLPVDEPDGLVLLTRTFFDFDSIAQEAIDGFVSIVEVLPFTEGSPLVEFAQGLVDQDVVHALLLQPLAQQVSFDVAVVFPVFPVAQLGIAQVLLKELHNTILGNPLPLTNSTHNIASSLALNGRLPAN